MRFEHTFFSVLPINLNQKAQYVFGKRSSFFSVLFIFLSIILHINISSTDSYLDIDSKAYVQRGLKFATQNSLVEGNTNYPPYFVVGYPLFLGLIYKVFGFNNFYVIWIQVLLALLSGFLLYRICRRQFNEKVALVAFAFFSFNLGYLVFSQFILTEILLSLFLLFFLDRFLLFFLGGEIVYLIQAMLTLGFSVLVKPAALYFIPIVLFLILLFFKKDLLQKFKLMLLVCLCFYLPIIGYMSFNKINYGQFRLSALDIENIYFWYYPNVLAAKNGTNSNVEREALGFLVKGNKFVDGNWHDIKKQFWQDLKESPMLFLSVWLKNVLKTFLGLYTTNMKVLVSDVQGGQLSFFKGQGSFLNKIYQYVVSGGASYWVIIVGILEFLWSLFRYFLCLVAFVYLLLKRKFDLFFIFTSFIFYFSFITGHDGCARFRMMFEFILIILAALGFYILFLSKNNRKVCLYE